MKIYQKEELFPSHPRRNSYHQRNIDQLHRIGCFIETSLLNSEVIHLTIFMTLQRKSCNRVLKTTISDFPALIFVEFMSNPDKSSLSIRQEVNLNDSSKNPSLFFMIAVNNHIFLQFIFINIFIATKMSTHKIVEIIDKFKSK